MKKSNHSADSPQKEPKPTLVENIWTILSIIIAILVVAGIKEDAPEIESEMTIMVTGLLLGLVGLAIKRISNAFYQ